MSATEPLLKLLDMNTAKLSREEAYVVEMELLTRTYGMLRDTLEVQHTPFLRLMRYKPEQVSHMIEDTFIRSLIMDIISTDEYSIEGIAHYTRVPIDVISDIAIGQHTSPSFELARKIIELHQTVRPKLYHEMIKKICVDWKLSS